VPVAALHSLLKQRELLDDEQELEVQKVHKTFTDKIKPLLERVTEKLCRPHNSSRAKTPSPPNSKP
jgi:hypothetical protein